MVGVYTDYRVIISFFSLRLTRRVGSVLEINNLLSGVWGSREGVQSFGGFRSLGCTRGRGSKAAADKQPRWNTRSHSQHYAVSSKAST